MVKKKETKKIDPIEVLKENVLLLASRVDELTNKVNEIVAVLNDNNLTRKVELDFIYSDEDENEDEEDDEESEDSEDEEDDEDLDEIDDEDEEDDLEEVDDEDIPVPTTPKATKKKA